MFTGSGAPSSRKAGLTAARARSSPGIITAGTPMTMTMTTIMTTHTVAGTVMTTTIVRPSTGLPSGGPSSP